MPSGPSRHGSPRVIAADTVRGVRAGIRYGVGLLLAAAAAVWWGVGMAALQPLTEPLGPWPETLYSGSAYWARDLRWAAIVAVAAGLVLAGGGDRRWVAAAVVLGGLWAAADVLVDRADLAGTPAAVLLAAAAVGIVALVAGLLHVRLGGPPAPVERRRLVITACVAAALLAGAACTATPQGNPAELGPAAVVTSLLTGAVAICCALAAGPPSAPARRWWALALAALTALAVWAVRLAPADGRTFPRLVLGTVLITGITLLAWDRPGGRPQWRWHGLAALWAFAGLQVVWTAVLLVARALAIGPSFTALAGNLPVAAPQEDVPVPLVALLTGLVLGLPLAWPKALGHHAGPTIPRPAGPDPAERLGRRGQDSL